MAATTDKPTDSVSSLERMYSSGVVEARSAGSGQLRIGGIAAPFGHRSKLIGDFYEEIGDQFFTESRSQGWPMVLCRAEHSPALLLGTVHARTLQLAVTNAGLEYECSLPPSRQDVFEGVARGDYGGSSFTFLCTDDEWSYTDGAPLRTLRSGQLRELGPVTVPAYPDASVAMRSLAKCMDANLADVQMRARSGELARFFTRSDNRGAPARTMTCEEAMARLEARRRPPWARGTATKTGFWSYDHEYRQRMLQLRARRIAGGW
jgi:HK97 family phage prohead protease